MKSSPLRSAKFQPASWVSYCPVVSTTKLMAGLSAFTGAMRGPLGAGAGAALLDFELVEPALDLARACSSVVASCCLVAASSCLHRGELAFRDDGGQAGNREQDQGRCAEQGPRRDGSSTCGSSRRPDGAGGFSLRQRNGREPGARRAPAPLHAGRVSIRGCSGVEKRGASSAERGAARRGAGAPRWRAPAPAGAGAGTARSPRARPGAKATRRPRRVCAVARHSEQRSASCASRAAQAARCPPRRRRGRGARRRRSAERRRRRGRAGSGRARGATRSSSHAAAWRRNGDAMPIADALKLTHRGHTLSELPEERQASAPRARVAHDLRLQRREHLLGVGLGASRPSSSACAPRPSGRSRRSSGSRRSSSCRTSSSRPRRRTSSSPSCRDRRAAGTGSLYLAANFWCEAPAVGRDADHDGAELLDRLPGVAEAAGLLGTARCVVLRDRSRGSRACRRSRRARRSCRLASSSVNAGAGLPSSMAMGAPFARGCAQSDCGRRATARARAACDRLLSVGDVEEDAGGKGALAGREHGPADDARRGVLDEALRGEARDLREVRRLVDPDREVADRRALAFEVPAREVEDQAGDGDRRCGRCARRAPRCSCRAAGRCRWRRSARPPSRRARSGTPRRRRCASLSQSTRSRRS